MQQRCMFGHRLGDAYQPSRFADGCPFAMAGPSADQAAIELDRAGEATDSLKVSLLVGRRRPAQSVPIELLPDGHRRLGALEPDRYDVLLVRVTRSRGDDRRDLGSCLLPRCSAENLRYGAQRSARPGPGGIPLPPPGEEVSSVCAQGAASPGRRAISEYGRPTTVISSITSNPCRS